MRVSEPPQLAHPRPHHSDSGKNRSERFMRLLTFQAKRFAWSTHTKTLEQVETVQVDREVTNAVVAYLHIEKRDEGDGKAKAFRQTLKHIKWIANKRSLKSVVLHSFTHLGGINADPSFVQSFMQELAQRLRATAYHVEVTPFGYFCAWTLDVYGDSLAKVYKEIPQTYQ